MYRTEIDGQDVVIRFSRSAPILESKMEKAAIQSILLLQNKILQCKNQFIATKVNAIGYIISYVHEGEVIDVQIQSVVPFQNFFIS